MKDDIQVTPLPQVDGAEALWCKIKKANLSAVVGTLYRAPNSGVDGLQTLSEYMQIHLKNAKQIILTGDYNLPDIDWNSNWSGHTEVASAETLLEIAFNFGLRQIIRQPTRVTSTSCSILDLIFISDNVLSDSATWEVLDGVRIRP